MRDHGIDLTLTQVTGSTAKWHKQLDREENRLCNNLSHTFQELIKACLQVFSYVQNKVHHNFKPFFNRHNHHSKDPSTKRSAKSQRRIDPSQGHSQLASDAHPVQPATSETDHKMGDAYQKPQKNEFPLLISIQLDPRHLFSTLKSIILVQIFATSLQLFTSSYILTRRL